MSVAVPTSPADVSEYASLIKVCAQNLFPQVFGIKTRKRKMRWNKGEDGVYISFVRPLLDLPVYFCSKASNGNSLNASRKDSVHEFSSLSGVGRSFVLEVLIKK